MENNKALNNKNDWKELEILDKSIKRKIVSVQNLFDNTYKLFYYKNNSENIMWYTNIKNEFTEIMKRNKLSKHNLMYYILEVYKTVLVKSFYLKRVNKISNIDSDFDRIA